MSCSPPVARFLSSSRVFVLLFLCTAAVALHAQEGRGFVASYALDEATPLGAEVRVRLSLRISNYSGFDYSSATLTLRDPLTPGAIFASIPIHFAPREDSLDLTADVSIPAREYRRWSKGATPQFVLDVKNISGKRRTFQLEAIPVPAREAR